MVRRLKYFPKYELRWNLLKSCCWAIQTLLVTFWINGFLKRPLPNLLFHERKKICSNITCKLDFVNWLNSTSAVESVQFLAYADDIDIVARNMRSLTDAYSRLEKEANKIGLHVNESKTKLMMVSPSQRYRALLGTFLKIGDPFFIFTDHGSWIGDQN